MIKGYTNKIYLNLLQLKELQIAAFSTCDIPLSKYCQMHHIVHVVQLLRLGVTLTLSRSSLHTFSGWKWSPPPAGQRENSRSQSEQATSEPLWSKTVTPAEAATATPTGYQSCFSQLFYHWKIPERDQNVQRINVIGDTWHFLKCAISQDDPSLLTLGWAGQYESHYSTFTKVNRLG